MLKALFVINPSSGKQNFLETIEQIVARLIMEQTVNHIDVVYTQKLYEEVIFQSLLFLPERLMILQII